MAVDRSQLNSANRDAYWRATQAQLKSAQTRGELFSLLGLGLLGLLLWEFPGPGDNTLRWAATIAALGLVVVALPQLFVARRKRRISAMRGLKCQHCGYVPHDTEISEVADTRQCQRCDESLG